MDLDRYFSRIGYAGPRAATLETLTALHAAHVEAIPFENLSPFLGAPVLLDPEALEEKLVASQRGGYCFEHNLLFSHVLEALGFRVRWLSARVKWNVPVDAVLPRTHMALLVDIQDDTYLADVGFGGMTLRLPLRFVVGIEQEARHERFRILGARHDFLLQARLREEWISIYRFDLQEQLLADYEVANWYTSTHPRSIFTTRLLMARMDPTSRHTLFNHRLSIHRQDGTTEHRDVETATELRKIFVDTFHIEVPDAPDLDARLERFLSRVKTEGSASQLGEVPRR